MPKIFLPFCGIISFGWLSEDDDFQFDYYLKSNFYSCFCKFLIESYESGNFLDIL